MAVDQSIGDARLTDETLAELGLQDQPFLENKKFSRFSDSTTQKVRATLEQNLRFGGAIHLFIGEKGVGKSVFLSQLLKHCKNNIKPFVAKGDENFDSRAFLAAVLHQLSTAEHDAESINDHIDELVPLFNNFNDDKMCVVLAIDDAHLAPVEEIAELINLMPAFTNESGEQTARLLLMGDSVLPGELDALAAEFEEGTDAPSITALLPMDETRIQDYLSSRLKQAGHTDAFPFTEKAVAKIFRESEGVPAGINASAANYLNQVYTPTAAGLGGKGFFAALGWPLMALGTAAVGLIAWGLSMFFTGDEKPDPVVSIDSSPVIASTETTDSPIIVGDSDSIDTTAVTQDTLIVGDNSTAQSTGTQSDDTATPQISTETISDSVETTGDALTELVQPQEQIVTVVPQNTAETTVSLPEPTTNAVETVTETIAATGEQADGLVRDTVVAAQDTVSTSSELLETVTETVSQRAEQISAEPLVVTQTDDQSVIAAQGTAQALPESVEVMVSGASSAVVQPVDDLLSDTTDAASVGGDDNGGIAVTVEPAVTDSNGVELNVTQADAEPAIQRAVENERWVLFQESKKFTVQLATSRERGYIINLAQTLPAQEPVAIYPFLTTNSKNPVFGLLSGLYETRQEAETAVDSMDPAAKQFGVWIRPIGDLQTAIKSQ